ncbi:NUDIX domain-containing protein [Acetobacteraceae bacterium H6797]|nr:NUDIX domain-containing protein [Acetobacteraceae bacterium H6797]
MLPTDFTASGEARAIKPARPKDAATVILWRRSSKGVEVLMGKRSAKLRFMPGRLVFPGGRVDPADARTPVAAPLPAATQHALERRATAPRARALAVAAARELLEETGLHLGALPEGGGFLPDLSRMGYLCRALTPAMSPVRFNARFLTAPAEMAVGSPQGTGELEAVAWHDAEAAFALELAPITAKVLREFLTDLTLTPEQRAARPMFWFQGRDTRRIER